MTLETMLWRRLDLPGHDACRLTASRTGWRLRGTAVFRHDAGPAHLRYDVRVDRHWRTREGRVDGWVGDRPVRIRVRRLASGWEVNGAAIDHARACVDLDLGFTPATNLLQLRRAALRAALADDVLVRGAALRVRGGARGHRGRLPAPVSGALGGGGVTATAAADGGVDSDSSSSPERTRFREVRHAPRDIGRGLTAMRCKR